VEIGFQLEVSNEAELDMEESFHDKHLVYIDFTQVPKEEQEHTLYISQVYHGVKDPIDAYMDSMFLRTSSIQIFKPKFFVCRSELQINSLFQLLHVYHSVSVKCSLQGPTANNFLAWLNWKFTYT